MSEPTPTYQTERPMRGADMATIPPRAADLARRILQLERQCGGRGRVTIEVIFPGGGDEWLMFISKPGPLERLGE